MYDWKSSAQTQQGYSLEKRSTKLSRSDCCAREGDSGYVAAIECSSVQELRPRASTSGGQSLGSGLGFFVDSFVAAAKVAKELHDRHLIQRLTINQAMVDVSYLRFTILV